MASRSFAPFLSLCKSGGYRIHCVYIWLRSPELSVARVAQRVKSGGNFVPDETVKSRYDRGIANFFKLYIPVSDIWAVYDNSGREIRVIAEKTENGILKIHDKTGWIAINRGYHVAKKRSGIIK